MFIKEPFPHFVIDDFLPASQLENVLKEFPDLSHNRWSRHDHVNAKKFAFNNIWELGGSIKEVFDFLSSPAFLLRLEEMTGILGLIPDPYFVGGGLHLVERGGFLKIHSDFNFHQRLQVYRCLNLLIFLNKDWKEEYGGHLEFWDRDMKNCHKKILPVFNRCVVFNTTPVSFHGHPDPLGCPEGMARKSLAVYYYTSKEVDVQLETNYQSRQCEMTMKSKIKRFVPPLVWDLLKGVYAK